MFTTTRKPEREREGGGRAVSVPGGNTVGLEPFLADVSDSQLPSLLRDVRDVDHLINHPRLDGREVSILQLPTLDQGLYLDGGREKREGESRGREREEGREREGERGREGV